VSGLVIAVVALAAVGIGLAAGWWLPPHGRRPARQAVRDGRRILLPFTGPAISRRAFEAAVRLAQAENATIVPAFLARVPRHLPVDAPLPAQCEWAMPLLEVLEQRGAKLGIPIDARISSGRSYRDALRRLLAAERFDRVIVSTESGAAPGQDGNGDALGVRAARGFVPGLSRDDLAWLLERVPSEVLIVRPAPEDTRRISASGVAGHF
jgi:nucleotide-binding universal stress UspA family protein